MKVGIIGQGYVGRTLGVAAHGVGHQVVGIEVNARRISQLKNSKYLVSSDISELKDCQVVVIAVPTPLDDQRQPDLSFILEACAKAKPFLQPEALVVNESTSYPGTLRDLIKPLLGEAFSFASAPERIDPGNARWSITNTPRLVSGLTPPATKAAAEFYRSFCDFVIEVSSPEVAESAKLLENTFRQVNIALVNEFAQIASKLGLSAHEVIEAAATKPYGFMKFMPSIGVGGHCIPVDPIYLSYIAKRHGASARFVDLANEVNLAMPEFIARRIDAEYGLSGKHVQISGISYKPGIDDFRESPSLRLIKLLREMGAQVFWFDPLVGEVDGERSTPIFSADIGIICTAHPNVDYGPWNENTIVLDVSYGETFGWNKYL